MLLHLHIKNYILVENLEFSPSTGLTSITGETGAGKSIILGAVGLIMGNRADMKALADKDKKCIIEGEFDVTKYALQPLFQQEELDYEHISIFRREISPSGKSRAFINDTPVTLEVFRLISKNLIDVHSQHQTLSLGKKGVQLQLVDNYANTSSILASFTDAFILLKSTQEALNRLKTEKEEYTKEFDYNHFLLDELQKASLQENEEQHLEQELEVLENAEEIKNNLFQAQQLLSGNEFNAENNIQEVKVLLEKLSSISKHYEDLYQRLDSTLIELQDISQSVQREGQRVDIDPGRTEEVQQRLSLIYTLKKKHNVSSTRALIAIAEELVRKSERNFDLDAAIKKAEEGVLVAEKSAQRLALDLSKSRRSAFIPLKDKLEQLLQELGITEAQVMVNRNEIPMDTNGIDDITILFSANAGVAPQPLYQVASGGELSRLMFCVKYILAEKAALPTIIFDEIDTGISGEIALMMGSMMQEMARGHQVIAITHLPQIASCGNTHFYVYKESRDGVAKSKIRILSDKERKIEIAKMIGGDNPSPAAYASAEELLINR